MLCTVGSKAASGLPEKRLFCSSRTCSDDNLDRKDGSGPVNSLSFTTTSCSFVKLAKGSRFPVNELF